MSLKWRPLRVRRRRGSSPGEDVVEELCRQGKSQCEVLQAGVSVAGAGAEGLGSRPCKTLCHERTGVKWGGRGRELGRAVAWSDSLKGPLASGLGTGLRGQGWE